MTTTDKLDLLILSELLKNAQMPFSSIAKKLGISPYTVAKRYEKMKNDGTIIRSVISIDLSKLGFQGKVFLMITNMPNCDKPSTIQELKKIENILVISEIIGAFDIIAIAPISDVNSLKTLVNAVKKIPYVQKVEITCIDDTSFPIGASFGKVLYERCIYLSEHHDDSLPST
jgi:Lrp/AsnC family transcriptional regulator, regulator for asnA, asnC and gidA